MRATAAVCCVGIENTAAASNGTRENTPQPVTSFGIERTFLWF